MVQFGAKISASEIDEFKGFYLDYNALKRCLDTLQADQQNALKVINISDTFKVAIDAEIEKVVLFFLMTQGDIASRLATLRAQQLTATSPIEMQALKESYRKVGDDLVKLVHFVELNVTGLRKILKKHDKKIHHSRITGAYISSRVDAPDSHLQQLYRYEGIGALVTTLKTALLELSVQEEQGESVTGKVSLFRQSSVSDWEPVLGKLNAARKRLAQSTQFVKAVAGQSLIFETEEDVLEEGYETFAREDYVPQSVVSNYLNLASTFLYMMNYYIVAPTSGNYAAELGLSRALSGLIIGMTPVAALVAAVLYSWWANRSFKSALLFASACSVMGNVLYALALPCDSLNLILAGRILNGFGGARAINRRYIADTFSSSERTAASAWFVTAGALGMSAGPAMAVFLKSQINDEWTTFTNETAPGWVMCIIWILYFILTAIFFQEPYRPPKVASPLLPLTDVPAETQRLLGLTLVSEKSSSNKGLSQVWSNIPVRTTLILYFVLKLVLECLLSSTALLTFVYFDWKTNESGIYLAILGLLMFPANYLLGVVSYRYDDRDMILMALLSTFFGIVVFVHYPGTIYTATQYILGSLIIFISTNILEGVNMSLLSKTIPRSLAKGTFNSGLLATEAGTLGRAVGDAVVTIVGLYGLDFVLDYTFVPMGIITLIFTGITARYYPYLVESEEDDE